MDQEKLDKLYATLDRLARDIKDVHGKLYLDTPLATGLAHCAGIELKEARRVVAAWRQARGHPEPEPEA